MTKDSVNVGNGLAVLQETCDEWSVFQSNGKSDVFVVRSVVIVIHLVIGNREKGYPGRTRLGRNAKLKIVESLGMQGRNVVDGLRGLFGVFDMVGVWNLKTARKFVRSCHNLTAAIQFMGVSSGSEATRKNGMSRQEMVESFEAFLMYKTVVGR